MKICILTDAWFPVWGGGQSHIWETANILVRDHHFQIDIIVPNIVDKNGKKYPFVEKYLGGKLRLFRLGSPFVFPNLFGRLIFILHSTFHILHSSYDLYHSHSYSTSIFLPVVRLVTGKPICFTLHGAGRNLLGGGIINALGLPRMVGDLVLYQYPYDALFSAAASSLEQHSAATKTAIVGNGVDVSRFEKIKVKKNIRLFKIIWVGRKNDPVKGVKYLEEAFVQVKKSNPQAILSLVDSKYGDELVKEYKSGDLFVLPSLSEGLPLVLLEAMAAKLTIVTTDVGDCKKLVEEARAGTVVKPADSSKLATAIEKLIKSKSLSKLGENGYKFVKNKYSWNTVAQRYNKAYRSMEKFREKMMLSPQ